MIRPWLPLLLLPFAPLTGQTVRLVEQVGLLSDAGNANLPFSSGIPIGVVDMNGDRRDDIVRLHDADFLNLEYQTTPGGAFEHAYHGQVSLNKIFGLAVADVDENGHADIVVGDIQSNIGHKLLLADATGSSFSSAVLTPTVDVSQGVIFADLDNDGLLDVLACDDVADNHKYRNTGGGAFVFQDSLLPTALPLTSDNEGNYAIVGTDYDNDGDTDYYLSKCSQFENSATSKKRINRMFRNNADGTYTDLPGAAGLASGDQTWAADFADIDNDGDLDCFLLNHQSGTSEPSLLFENDGTGAFTDITAAAGLSGEIDFWGIQSLFRDFNNDGWIDLLVGGMGVFGQLDTYGFYQNNGDGTFTTDNNILRFSDLSPVDRIHSFGAGDLNHDGFLDLYAGRARNISTLTNDRDLLLFNQGNSHSFLSVTLVGDQSNLHGVGARIEAHGPWGVQVREVRGGESYGIMNSYNAHFGLGSASEVAQLKVRWPSGTVDDILTVPGNRFLSVHEGTGTVAMSYGDWITDYFPAGGANADPESDPDGDSTPNLIEQIRGTNPIASDHASGLLTTVEDDGGQSYFRVALARVPAQDVALHLEFSENGTVWDTPPSVEVIEDTPLSYIARLPVDPASNPPLLARLVVTITTP